MKKLSLKLLKREKNRKSGKSAKPSPSPTSKTGSAKDTQPKQVIMRGFARSGDLLATVKPGDPGKEGKNVLGESVHPKRVKNPNLIAGENVKTNKDLSYYSNVDGKVEVLEDDRGNNIIQVTTFRHGGFEITVSEDEMAAHLSVSPAVGGGDPAAAEEILAECQTRGITFGLKNEALTSTVADAESGGKKVSDILIAAGNEPVNGVDGRFVLKTDLASGDKIKLLEDGKVDFKEQDLYTQAGEGQLLGIVTKPIPGRQNGHTVTGKEIQASGGTELTFEIGNNIRVEEDGKTIKYYSEIDGQLIADETSLTVEPVLQVAGDVGPKTGNIHFNGFVHVQGSVDDNYTIFGEKGVVVEGSVGSAEIRSAADISIAGGVMGREKGLLLAKNNVSVKFAENAHIQAGGSIEIQRAALNCTLQAGNKIKSMMEKGQIIGGKIQTKEGMEVKILGNDLEHKMEVYVGVDFVLESRIEKTRTKVERYKTALQKILSILERIRADGSDPLPADRKKIYDNAVKKRGEIETAIKEMSKSIHFHSERAQQWNRAEVAVSESLYPGVTMIFDNVHYSPDAVQTAVTVYFDAKERSVKTKGI